MMLRLVVILICLFLYDKMTTTRMERVEFKFDKYDFRLEYHFEPKSGKNVTFDGKAFYQNLICKGGEEFQKVPLGHFQWKDKLVRNPTLPLVIREEAGPGTNLEEFAQKMITKYSLIEMKFVCPRKKGTCRTIAEICSSFNKVRFVTYRSFWWFLPLGLLFLF